MNRISVAGAALLLAATSGCASIIEGTSQTITLNTNPPGANCALVREGIVIGRVAPTPGSVVIEKTKHDITITCTKEGYQEATYLNHSGAAGATFGNIILGGGIGWAIDSASGADNKYDSPVNMTMVPEPASVAATTQAPASAEIKSADAPSQVAWNVGGVDVCGQPWSMKLEASNGKLAGELWRANIKYDVAGLLSAQGPHHASAIKAQNGVPGPRFLKVDLDLSKDPGTGVLWVDGDGTDNCRSEFQLASE
jgi:hypothetical protein